MRFAVVSLVAMLLLSSSLGATVIVNEVMVNGPGSSEVEWVELYNAGGASVGLGFSELWITSGGSTHTYALSGTINAGQYMIISADTARFRQEWGNTPFASGLVAQLPISLNNTAGDVALYRIDVLQSQLAWDDAGEDGISWERVGPESDSVAASLDPRGGTPNEVNSHAPVAVDLAFDEIEPRADNGGTIIAFEIVNRSLTQITDGILELYYYDAGAPYQLGDWIASESIGALEAGYTLILIGRYELPGIYRELTARIVLDGDLRTYNNRVDFMAPGTDYPPLLLTEVLANPESPLASEWVEIKNVSNETIDLEDWQLGDSVGLSAIATTSLLVDPGEYFVLAKDTAAFLTYYDDFEARCWQPSSWRALNNGSDSVRLVDPYDLSADRFYYDATYDSNYTWSRGESEDRLNQWGRSAQPGGTPGALNEVVFPGEVGETLEITIEPRIFSPDGDGIRDTTVITVLPSAADGYTLKIYDAQGRLVRTFEDGASVLAEHYVWNGRTDGGERLPIGIYIVYFESEGVESAKKTVVIAR